MRSRGGSNTNAASHPSSAARQYKEDDTTSVHSGGSQDTNMSDIDHTVSKSIQDGQADIRKGRVSGGLAKLVFGADIEQIRIETVRASNSKADRLRGLVVVFVGGTGGIGSSTAFELFRHTTTPKAYIIGRNADRGEGVVRELEKINPGGTAIFLRTDVSLLKNVDKTCEELKRREKKINCLFLTAGYLSVKGRDETVKGLDRKMTTNYYSRIRWASNLMPLLTAAADAGELSRVSSVLAAGSEGNVRLDDLDLRHHFSLHACLAHCVVMTDFMIEELAKRYPGTSFSHSYPGSVKTGIANELTGAVRLATKVLYAILSPWILNVQESGERHLFQITSQCYPAADGPSIGIDVPRGLHVMRGSNGEVGSGAYLLDWDGKPTGDRKVLDKYRSMDLGQTVWEHTMQMFERAERFGRSRGEKRPAVDGSPESSSRSATKRAADNPVGWRPA